MPSPRFQAFNLARSPLTPDTAVTVFTEIWRLWDKQPSSQSTSKKDMERLYNTFLENPTYTSSLALKIVEHLINCPDHLTSSHLTYLLSHTHFTPPDMDEAARLSAICILGSTYRPNPLPDVVLDHPTFYATLPLVNPHNFAYAILNLPHGKERFVNYLAQKPFTSLDYPSLQQVMVTIPRITNYPGYRSTLPFPNFSLTSKVVALSTINPLDYLSTPALAASLAAHTILRPIIIETPPQTLALLLQNVPEEAAQLLLSKFAPEDFTTWPRAAFARALSSTSPTVKKYMFTRFSENAPALSLPPRPVVSP